MQHHAFLYKAVASSRLNCFVATCEFTALAHSRKSFVIPFLLVQFQFSKMLDGHYTSMDTGPGNLQQKEAKMKYERNCGIRLNKCS